MKIFLRDKERRDAEHHRQRKEKLNSPVMDSEVLRHKIILMDNKTEKLLVGDKPSSPRSLYSNCIKIQSTSMNQRH